jgi:hypothetical protein
MESHHKKKKINKSVRKKERKKNKAKVDDRNKYKYSDEEM